MVQGPAAVWCPCHTLSQEKRHKAHSEAGPGPGPCGVEGRAKSRGPQTRFKFKLCSFQEPWGPHGLPHLTGSHLPHLLSAPHSTVPPRADA